MLRIDLCSTGNWTCRTCDSFWIIQRCFVSRPDYLYSDLVLLSMSVDVWSCLWFNNLFGFYTRSQCKLKGVVPHWYFDWYIYVGYWYTYLPMDTGPRTVICCKTRLVFLGVINMNITAWTSAWCIPARPRIWDFEPTAPNVPLYVEVLYYLWSTLVQSSFSYTAPFGVRHVIARTFGLITKLHHENHRFQSHSLSTAREKMTISDTG